MSETKLKTNTPSSPTFIMHGCREVLSLSSGAIMLERQMVLLEESVYKNPSLAFDAARSLIETICKTILKDLGETPDTTGRIEVLFRQTITHLKLVPDAHAGNIKLTNALRDTINGLSNSIVGLGRIRNEVGLVSHGKMPMIQVSKKQSMPNLPQRRLMQSSVFSTASIKNTPFM